MRTNILTALVFRSGISAAWVSKQQRLRITKAALMSCTVSDTTAAAVAATQLPSLPSFLKTTFDDCVTPNTIRGPSHVTIGNEAGDADSIVSALVHSNVLSLEDAIKGRAGADKQYVPLVAVPRSDLPLRRETTLLLNMAGIDPGSLLCVDDPPSVVSLLRQAPDDLLVSLLDHNRIRSSLRHLDPQIVEILDHHEDEGDHSHVTGNGEARNIAFEGRNALVGSTCTLVAERLLHAIDALKETEEYGETTIDPSASLALLGVILIDTMDMSPEAGKGTPRDLAAIEALLSRTDWTTLDRSGMSDSVLAVFDQDHGFTPKRAALHDLLRNSKFDKEFWSDMSAWDCLRIDYKRFEPSRASNMTPPPVPFGMSSILLPLADFLSKDDCAESLVKYLSPDAGADVPLLGVLTMTLIDDKPYREMLLVGRPDLVDASADFLVGDDSEAAFLEIEEVSMGDIDISLTELSMRRFRQGNPKGSRKQVAPVLLKLAATLQI